MIRADVELIDGDFDVRCKTLTFGTIKIKLTVEDGQKGVYISCRLDRTKLSIMNKKRGFS